MHQTIMSNINLVLMQTSMTCTSNEEIHQPFPEASSSATLPVVIWQYSNTEHLVSLPSSLAIRRSPSFLRARWNLSRKIKHKMRTAKPTRRNQPPKSSLLRSKIWCWRTTQPSSTWRTVIELAQGCQEATHWFQTHKRAHALVRLCRILGMVTVLSIPILTTRQNRLEKSELKLQKSGIKNELNISTSWKTTSTAR